MVLVNMKNGFTKSVVVIFSKCGAKWKLVKVVGIVILELLSN